MIILAVPHENANDAIEEIRPYADGKIVVDVINAVGSNMELGISCTTSSAEETQKKLPKAMSLKHLTQCLPMNQSTGKVGKEQITAFIAGDDYES